MADAQQVVNPRILEATENPDPTSVLRAVIIRLAYNVNRQSVEYLVDFLNEGTHEMTALDFSGFELLEPSDGGLNVLCDFFTNQTTLSKVRLGFCYFGSSQEASRLFAALQESRTVTDLTIYGTINLQGTALGKCISCLLQSIPQLQRLRVGPSRDAEAIRAFQPGLRTNRNLKILDLSDCGIENEGLLLIVDALVGNTTMEVLDLSRNSITSSCLDDINRLMEFTRLQVLRFRRNYGVFDDKNAVQRFANVLSRSEFLTALAIRSDGSADEMIFQALERNNVLESLYFQGANEQGLDQLIDSLPRIKGLKRLTLNHGSFRYCIRNASFLPALHQNTSLEKFTGIKWNRIHAQIRFQIKNILTRNRGLRRADLLLAPLQPRTLVPIAAKSSIWCMAFARMTKNNVQINAEQELGSMDDSSSSDDSGSSDDLGSWDDSVSSDYEAEEDNDADDDNNNNAVAYPGASAIFKILQARPKMTSTSDDGIDNEEETASMYDDSVSSNESQGDHEEDDDDSAAGDVNYSGASAIFKILQARPAILQPLLRRPSAVATATTATSCNQSGSTTTRQQLHYSRGGDSNSAETGAAAGCNKRRRL